MKAKQMTLLMLLALSTACASNSNTQSTGAASSVSDIEYHLPELVFEVKAEYQLRACGIGENKNGINTSFLKVTTKADLSSKYIASDESYTFSPSQTSALAKRSDHDFTLSLRNNRTLESFNSEVTDKTGSIVGSAIKFLTNILTLGFANSADVQKAIDNKQPLVNPCLPGIVTHLETAKTFSMAVETHEATLQTLLTKATISEDDGAQIVRTQQAIAALKEQLTIHRMENLTIKHTFTIEPDDLQSNNPLVIPNDKLRTWIKKDDAALSNKLMFDLALSDKPSNDPTAVSAEPTSIIVRKPVMSTYRLCRGICPDPLTQSIGITELARGQVEIPQWGNNELVNFAVRSFEKRTVNMSLNEAGAVTKLSWSRPSSANSAFSAIAGMSESAVGLVDVAQYGRELAATRALKVETDLVSQRNALREAQNKQDVLFSTAKAEEPDPEIIRVILIEGEDS